MTRIRDFVGKKRERIELEERRDELEDLFTKHNMHTTKAGVQGLVDFTLRVSRYNGYEHDLILLPSEQYRTACGATAGVPVEDVEVDGVIVRGPDGEVVPIAHSYSVDTITLVNTDDLFGPEDLS